MIRCRKQLRRTEQCDIALGAKLRYGDVPVTSRCSKQWLCPDSICQLHETNDGLSFNAGSVGLYLAYRENAVDGEQIDSTRSLVAARGNP